MSESVRVVKLHEFPQLLNDCALLLNEEWPRSVTARLHSLNKSCDSLPISLILINSENRVLGHIRVKDEFTDTSSAFIESLIVDKNERGNGFGKLLVTQTEILIKRMGFKRITLTTVNQIGFYESLGFIKTNNQLIVKNDVMNNNEQQFETKAVPSAPPPPPLPLTRFNDNNVKVLMHKCLTQL